MVGDHSADREITGHLPPRKPTRRTIPSTSVSNWQERESMRREWPDASISKGDPLAEMTMVSQTPGTLGGRRFGFESCRLPAGVSGGAAQSGSSHSCPCLWGVRS
jgi:hypothetical protein